MRARSFSIFLVESAGRAMQTLSSLMVTPTASRVALTLKVTKFPLEKGRAWWT